MKFVKKPIPIDAFQWTGHNFDQIANFMGDNHPVVDGSNNLFIHTLEGEMKAIPGSWIIRGPKGEYYPCKEDIFEETYMRIDD